MNNQKGLAPILVVFLIVVAVGGFFVYTSVSENIKTKKEVETSQTPQSTPSLSPSNATNDLSQYEEIDRSSSPDGSYTVVKSRLADHLKLSIQGRNGKVIVEDIISLNKDQIWKNMEKLGLKGKGQVGYSVKEWKNNLIFVLQISPASGDEFEVEVAPVTGKIDESTFKKVK